MRQKLLAQTKVGEHHVTVGVKQYVFELQIAVDDSELHDDEAILNRKSEHENSSLKSPKTLLSEVLLENTVLRTIN